MVESKFDSHQIASCEYKERVKDAMQQTLSQLLFHNPNLSIPIAHDPEKYITEFSTGSCVFYSKYALKNVFDVHSKYFETGFLLSSVGYHYNSADWRHHTLFVVRGMNNRYYAGSPANYGVGVGFNKAGFAVYEGCSATELIDNIVMFEKGEWPDFERKEVKEKIITPYINSKGFFVFSKVTKHRSSQKDYIQEMKLRDLHYYT